VDWSFDSEQILNRYPRKILSLPFGSEQMNPLQQGHSTNLRITT
jgi:hypothetical protein